MGFRPFLVVDASVRVECEGTRIFQLALEASLPAAISPPTFDFPPSRIESSRVESRPRERRPSRKFIFLSLSLFLSLVWPRPELRPRQIYSNAANHSPVNRDPSRGDNAPARDPPRKWICPSPRYSIGAPIGRIIARHQLLDYGVYRGGLWRNCRIRVIVSVCRWQDL